MRYVIPLFAVASLMFAATAQAHHSDGEPPHISPCVFHPELCNTPPPAPTPVVSGSTCPAGYGPYGGKDGDFTSKYANQSCCPDSNLNQKCDDLPYPYGDLPRVS